MKKQIFLVWSLSILFSTMQAQNNTANKFTCDKSQSSITYSMSHPLHDWSGISKDVVAVILTNDSKTELKGVAVAAKVQSFDSDNANRDSHMMEVTEALKYPLVTFKATNIKQISDKTYRLTGMLTFHGVSKEVSSDAERNSTKGKTRVTGGFTVKISDFNIQNPSLMGIECKDEIRMKYDLVFLHPGL